MKRQKQMIPTKRRNSQTFNELNLIMQQLTKRDEYERQFQTDHTFNPVFIFQFTQNILLSLKDYCNSQEFEQQNLLTQRGIPINMNLLGSFEQLAIDSTYSSIAETPVTAFQLDIMNKIAKSRLSTSVEFQADEVISSSACSAMQQERNSESELSAEANKYIDLGNINSSSQVFFQQSSPYSSNKNSEKHYDKLPKNASMEKILEGSEPSEEFCPTISEKTMALLEDMWLQDDDLNEENNLSNCSMGLPAEQRELKDTINQSSPTQIISQIIPLELNLENDNSRQGSVRRYTKAPGPKRLKQGTSKKE